MAGAAVIVAVTNAMAGRDFPFVFGGDGASFAVPAAAGPLARQALAETATWVKEDLDLTLADRHGAGHGDSRAGPRRPRRALRAVGEHLDRDVLGRRHGLGRLRHEAWRDRRAEPAPPGAHPDLSGLSCRYEEIPASRGLVLSLVVAPGAARRRPRASAPRSRRSPASSRKPPTHRGRCRASGCASPGRRRAPTSRRALRGAPASRSWRARSRCWRWTLFCVPRHALRHHGRQLHPGEIHPRADRQFRLPEVRRFAPHGARLHARTRRRDRAASRRSAPPRASSATARTASRRR